MPGEYNGCIRCEAPDCYVQPGVKSEMPEFLPKLWNQMAMIDCEDEKQESDKFHQPYLNPCVRCGGLGLIEGDSTERRAWCYSCDNEIIIKGKSTKQQIIDAWNEENPILNLCVKCGFPAKRRNYPDTAMVYCPECMESCIGKTMAEAVRQWNEKNPEEEEKLESQNETIKMVGPFKPCAKCGSPVEWEISFSRGDAGFVKCPRCGNGITFNNGDFSSVDEVVEKWNQANKPEESPERSNNTERIFPDENSLMLKIKLNLLNSILGLQRDAVGPVIEVKEIQETLVEIVKAIHDGVKWDNLEPIEKLACETEKMKKDPYLIPSEKKNIPIRGSVYVTELHIARAVCQEAEMLVWKYEQKNGI